MKTAIEYSHQGEDDGRRPTNTAYCNEWMGLWATFSHSLNWTWESPDGGEINQMTPPSRQIRALWFEDQHYLSVSGTFCVWKAVLSHSSHDPQLSLYVHRGGLKPHSFHSIFWKPEYQSDGRTCELHEDSFNPFSAGIDFLRQNLTRQKSIPMLQELKKLQ